MATSCLAPLPMDAVGRMQVLEGFILDVPKYQAMADQIAKSVATARDVPPPAAVDLTDQEQSFAESLFKDARQATSIFTQGAEDILQAAESRSKGFVLRFLSHKASSLTGLLTKTGATSTSRPFRDLILAQPSHSLAAAARVCLAFAEANRTALREVEEVLRAATPGSSLACEMSTILWRRAQLGGFLNSPLLSELRSLVSLQEAVSSSSSGQGEAEPTAPRRRLSAAWRRQRLPLSDADSSNWQNHCHSAEASRQSKEHTSFWQTVTANAVTPPEPDCPICLMAVFRPVGLSCGHYLCSSCLEGVLRSSRQVEYPDKLQLRDPATQRARVCCPECRQSSSLSMAREMRLLDQLSHAARPQEWAEQQRAFRADLCERAAARAESLFSGMASCQAPPAPAVALMHPGMHPCSTQYGGVPFSLMAGMMF
eukprot:CAMPEP_0117677270 /NCGR_PEP_ID=MMETSP0804-20121206/16655_1 /TAXON_ID=1074897 /ORGANISM="Tetraselmis astigmatica, Strain CCMP880" /LENGTH=426 /DNA_ID=CAMNT_0005486541 /DNA_START=246 /DNA_END=1526 /DNA_ORIENTATION=-